MKKQELLDSLNDILLEICQDETEEAKEMLYNLISEIKQCAINGVVWRSKLLCFCESDRKLFTASVYCPKHDKMIDPE